MSEEEKQAYDYLEKYIEWETSGERNLEEDIKTILNLVNKQQKEIERLKEFEKYYENEKVVWQRKDYISKEKIREKLEKIEELYDEKAKAENFEYNNNQFIVDFIALVEELFEV